jgi:hypothetical protein
LHKKAHGEQRLADEADAQPEQIVILHAGRPSTKRTQLAAVVVNGA